MKANVNLVMQPWVVPNFVRCSTASKSDDSNEQNIAVPLKDIDPSDLQRMCDEFAATIFQKAGKSPPPTCEQERPKPDVTEMVNRFLSWKLPRDFAPDCHISFKMPDPILNPNPTWPVGTNLLTADQARQMFEYALSR